MSELWIAVGAASLVVIAALVWPLLRRREGPAPARRDYDLAVWRDQLAEIERDVARGAIDPAQAEAARIEVKRRILASDRADGDGDSPPTRRSLAAAAAVAGIVPVAALAGYLALGVPDAPDQPLAARIDPVPSPVAAADRALAAAIDGLQARLATDPNDETGWLMLGRAYRAQQRFADAAMAFRQAWELSGRTPALAVDYGEALVGAAGGTVGEDAGAAFRAALAGDPANAKARYYLSLQRAQDGDLAGALQGWIDLLAISPPDAPWLAVVRRQVGRAAAELGIDPATMGPSSDVAALTGPPALTPEQVEAVAGMSAEDRVALIRSMVDQLAARLEETPNDRTGWLRLARAFDILGEAEKAAEARARAAGLAAPQPR